MKHLAWRTIAPLVVAVLAAGWLLWTRTEPHRQGGYCTNVTAMIGEAAARSGAGANTATGSADEVLRQIASRMDPDRLQVRTPPAVAKDVAFLRRRLPELRRSGAEPSPTVIQALTRVFGDYQQRCFGGGTLSTS